MPHQTVQTSAEGLSNAGCLFRWQLRLEASRRFEFVRACCHHEMSGIFDFVWNMKSLYHVLFYWVTFAQIAYAITAHWSPGVLSTPDACHPLLPPVGSDSMRMPFGSVGKLLPC